jgi:hypothetical protein
VSAERQFIGRWSGSLGLRNEDLMTKESMTTQTREIYHSSNGDRWLLARDVETGKVFVMHEANPASGGQRTNIRLGTFLSQDGRGPEHQELLRLIGTLVEEASPAWKT